MAVAALFASHTPLKDFHQPADDVVRDVDTELAAMQKWVSEFAPDIVVAAGPDHFNAFFYHLMPSFCIGTAAESVGDWNTPPGPLPVAETLAADCVRALQAGGVDVAVSHRMGVDHGITQLLNQMFDWDNLPPVVPLFINCAAPPLPPLQRVIALGRGLGEFVARQDLKILLTASGGLSHDPPVPVLDSAPAPVRERLIAGGTLSPEARAERQQRVLDDATGQVSGSSPRTPLNPAWDTAFLDALEAGDFERICAMDDVSITRDAGCGGHEVRTWLAIAAAARAAGISSFQRRYYRAIPEWVAGFGLMTADPAGTSRRPDRA